MAYIYCITNIVNGKKYIGKTINSITKRFRQHLSDSKRSRCNKRPLCSAINKYGADNFVVEKLIECNPDELSSYEIMFIEKYDTYHNGYNATLGGDGKILFDYKKIIDLYKSGMTIKDVARLSKCCTETVATVLNACGVDRHKFLTGNCKQRKAVKMINVVTGKDVMRFTSIADAAHWLVDNGYAKTYNGGVRQKISLCAQNRQNTAYKFKWAWI